MFIHKFINGPLRFVKVFDNFTGMHKFFYWLKKISFQLIFLFKINFVEFTKFDSKTRVVQAKMWDYVKNKFGFSQQRKFIKFIFY